MGKKYEDMTVIELKDRLRKKNLPVSGKKADLIKRLRTGKTSKTDKPQILDKALYDKAVKKVKSRVKAWPSAYASGQVVKEYKRLGGRYSGNKSGSDLDRWYREKWVNVCKSGYPKCGRKESKISNYPYCRPINRISSKTPMTVSEFKKKYGAKKLTEKCKEKKSGKKAKSLKK